jgi:hypothetical protein
VAIDLYPVKSERDVMPALYQVQQPEKSAATAELTAAA